MPYRSTDAHDFEIAREVRIETHEPNGSVRSTSAWVVVDQGQLYVRAAGGPSAAWYRDALADPNVEIDDAGRRLETVATPISDPAVSARVSDLVTHKYADTAGLEAMLAPDAVSTTLRLDARFADERSLEGPANFDGDAPSLLGPAVDVAPLDAGPALQENVILQPQKTL
jgi:hypothetical protein